MTLYLLDANILITAHNNYYPIDQVPEFWTWIRHQGTLGNVKIPLEIMEEIREGRDDEQLLDWVKLDVNRKALLFDEPVRNDLVQRVVNEGYAKNLTDDQIEILGRDPFLISYALAAPERCIVTAEVSKPKKTGHNRQVPDVCETFQVEWCGPFKLNKALGFKTGWKP
jgi:hypothetical protein